MNSELRKAIGHVSLMGGTFVTYGLRQQYLCALAFELSPQCLFWRAFMRTADAAARRWAEDDDHCRQMWEEPDAHY